MARTIRRAARLPRTIVIMHRGRSATSAGTGANGVYYVASVRGGSCDLELTFADGAPQPVVPPPGRSLEAMDYETGPAASLAGGFGWNGDGTLSVPFIQLVSEDTFDAYTVGSVAEGALSEGFGWNGSAALFAW